MIYIGKVLDINDPNGGDRIKVRLLPSDKWKNGEDVGYAFPLLPKNLHIKPKVGESVFVMCASDDTQASQRYYIGPLISQPQNMYYDSYQFGATNLLKDSVATPKKTIDMNADATGALAKSDEVAIYSRQNTDIILSNNDVRIRCGSRLLTPSFGYASNDNIKFNKKNSAFIKLKYFETPLTNTLQPKAKNSQSTATIVADEIALISNKSTDPDLRNGELYDKNEQISDETMQKIINEAHVLPYGDILVDFLMGFLQVFKSHTHSYSQAPPVEDDFAKTFDKKFGRGDRDKTNNDYLVKNNNVKIEVVENTFKGLYDKLLSKNVRIN